MNDKHTQTYPLCALSDIYCKGSVKARNSDSNNIHFIVSKSHIIDIIENIQEDTTEVIYKYHLEDDDPTVFKVSTSNIVEYLNHYSLGSIEIVFKTAATEEGNKLDCYLHDMVKRYVNHGNSIRKGAKAQQEA